MGSLMLLQYKSRKENSCSFLYVACLPVSGPERAGKNGWLNYLEKAM